MPLQQDRVVRFGELSGSAIEGKPSIEFKNIPTDFCQLNIHIVGQAELQTTSGYQNAQDFYVDTTFQDSYTTGGVLSGTARMDQSQNYYKSRTIYGNQQGTLLLGICNTFNVANYGFDQFMMRYYVMEPGSARGKSVQFESFFASSSPNSTTENIGQYRIDSQMAGTNSAAVSEFNKFKVSLRAQYPGDPTIPNQYKAVFGPGSRAWLEGWGGGHI